MKTDFFQSCGHLQERPKIVKLLEAETRTVVTRGWGRGGEKGEMGVFQLVKVSLMQDELVLEICCTV